MVNYRKTRSLLGVKFVSPKASPNAKPKETFFKQNRWRFSKKAKSLIAIAIIIIILVSIFASLPKQPKSTPKTPITPQSTDSPTASPSSTPKPTNKPSTPNPTTSITQYFGNLLGTVEQAISPPKGPGLIESSPAINNSVWMRVAVNAWSYFEPGVGIDVNTGLPYADGLGFTDFTDWDLGCYIQATIDAQKLGIMDNGTLSFNNRISTVLTFLNYRDLNSYGYPYQFYDATTGNFDTSESNSESVDVVDTGRLFVALNNLIEYNSSFQKPVDEILARSNYTALVPGIESEASSNSIYSYYVASGFASFFPSLSNVPVSILNNIVSAQNVTIGNATLPEAQISGDPLYCSVFELNNNNSQLMALANQVYLAHAAFYNLTGEYVAFSEGNSPSNGYIWEWVVLPNGDTFKITGPGSGAYLNISPVCFTKIAYSFLSLYNTTFARNMCVFLEKALPDPSGGYCNGVDANGNQVFSVGSNTNSLILDAALYAEQNFTQNVAQNATQNNP